MTSNDDNADGIQHMIDSMFDDFDVDGDGKLVSLFFFCYCHYLQQLKMDTKSHLMNTNYQQCGNR
jgi:hypothetical protein